ncbi:ubiquitin carboxyl-terminal hydrolase 16 isoform X2 [Bombina bombina]|nr:ubiquitin carboxyl-terminal hydrolase 16 isoform X2 [Bombina bombina]
MGSVWCYLCDNEVPCVSSGRLKQLVDYIQKKSMINAKTPNSEKEVNTNESLPEKEENKEDNVTKEASNAHSNGKETTVKGLSNLGNTCFFNAVMQNLSQTPALRELLNEVKIAKKTVKVKLLDSSSHLEVNPEQQPGPLTLAMCQFLTEMQETKKGVVTPKELFSQVCKKAIRFKGYQQQDSQELLRYLLDGMRGEEIQRISAAMSKTLLENSENIDEDEVKKKVKDCEKRRTIPNFVDCLFGGELTSTIMCEVCHTVSLVHEPFLDLSLPVLDESLVKKNSPKTCRVVDEKMEEEKDDRYVKEKNDEFSGTSKHLQKKAKKQAKKQSKNQRRQQKFQKAQSLNDDGTNPDEANANGESISQNDTENETSPKLEDEITTEKQCLNEDDSERLQNNAENGIPCPKNATEAIVADQELENKITTLNLEQDIKINTDSLTNCTNLDASELENNFNTEIASLENNINTEIASLENNINTEIASLENNINTEKASLENNINTEKASLENNINTEKASLENNIETNSTIVEDNDKETMTLGHGDVTQMNNEDAEIHQPATPAFKCPNAQENTDQDELTDNLNRLNLSNSVEAAEIEIEIIDDHEPAMTQLYEVVNEDPVTAFCTLSDRQELPADECSVLSCLYQFTHKESLVGNNQLLCNTCTKKQINGPRKNNKGVQKHVYTNAKKQMLVSLPPPVLTLHLKRFQQHGFNLHKINRHVKFPEVIDLSPFCTTKCKNIIGDSALLYSLYGVIEHSGTMRSGHYTAYVKSRNPSSQLFDLVLKGILPEVSGSEPPMGHWYHISDSHVQAVPLTKVLNSQAYLLFYERIL